MKKLILSIGIILFSVSLFGQKIKARSAAKYISFKQEVNTTSLRQFPDLIITNKIFSDNTDNNIINANEKSNLSFTLENNGKGVGLNVFVKLIATGNSLDGLSFSSTKRIGDLYPTQKTEVNLPIVSNMDLHDGKTTFRIEVLEENGFDADPFEFEIKTMSFRSPRIVVADAIFSTDDGGKIKPAYPVNLKILVQNIGEGDAQEITANIVFMQQNCLMLSETDRYNIGALKPNETKELNFQFTTNKRYSSNEIPIKIFLKESFNKYAEDKLLTIGLEQDLKITEQVVITGINQSKTNITIASLSAETDKNIPINTEKFPNRYALIIGNEDYTKYQIGLNTESNVAFARNDATVFAEYARKTLGVKDENLYLLIDATSGEMKQNIELVKKLLSKIGEEAELIFYYAGHGLPDEITKVPYLIPVDVSGTNPKSGILLSKMYKQFAETGAKRITIFLDACFSGGARNQGLLATRGIKIKPNSQVVTGNMVVMAATQGKQSALPYNEKKHGMFTYFLLKKLQDSKGNVSYDGLSKYIKQNVSLQSLKINKKEQDPQITVSFKVKEKWLNWNFK